MEDIDNERNAKHARAEIEDLHRQVDDLTQAIEEERKARHAAESNQAYLIADLTRRLERLEAPHHR